VHDVARIAYGDARLIDLLRKSEEPYGRLRVPALHFVTRIDSKVKPKRNRLPYQSEHMLSIWFSTRDIKITEVTMTLLTFSTS